MKYKDMMKTLKGKMVLIPAIFAVTVGLVLTGCGDADALEPNTQTSEIVSEVVSEETTEEISEVVSEETTEIASEVITEEEPTIVNEVLTFEEAGAYIENLKTLYPNMSDEEIVALFVNFNIHSLDSESINYYSSNYDCVIIHNLLYDKFITTITTRGVAYEGKEGLEYKDFWTLTDFITNEQIKPMAKEIETQLTTMAYTTDVDEYKTLKNGLYNYMIGEHDCFTFDYDNEQKTDTDLEGICYFVANYNNICNQQEIGYNEAAYVSPIERYQNELSLSK
ncbi:MAG: hypothetical protein IJ291_00855 [Lachnospiraceae bacterium]|nr:hypothetical protein [Lachnospiraceae bacterium]